jgi:hypothetical protein
VQGATTASNYEWNEYASDLHANIDHIDVMIVWTAGGTPNAEPRAYQAALWEGPLGHGAGVALLLAQRHEHAPFLHEQERVDGAPPGRAVAGLGTAHK